jgi:YegS/Rv2252/BmrU family lipid kinase
MTKNIVLIGNPIAGGGALKKIEKAADALKEKGLDVRLMLTSKKGDAEEFARQISLEFGVRGSGSESNKNSKLLIIAAGGDGTYNEIANGLVYSNVPMAILPLGTTSVLAKELKIPSNIERALEIAINGKIQTVHLGRIRFIQKAESHESEVGNLKISNHQNLNTCSSITTRHFLLMAGIGFDGEAVYGVNKKIKKYSGKGAYILSGIKAFYKYNPKPILIKAQALPPMPLFSENKKKELQKLQGYIAIICKASCYGGNYKITPDAKLTDQYLYAFVTHSNGRFDILRYIAGIITRRHLTFKDISYFKASEIEIQGNAHIQIDGDYLGTAPAKIDVTPHSLKLVCPPQGLYS